MKNKLFIGNIPLIATDDDLESFFGKVGEVKEARVVRHKNTGKSRGFAFVTMRTAEEAEAALEELHKKPFRVNDVERNIHIQEAKP